MNIQKQLVIQDFGYTILPLVSVINEFRAGSIKVTPILDPAFSRVITLAMHSTRNIPKHIRIISREIIGCVEQSIDEKKWPNAQWIYES